MSIEDFAEKNGISYEEDLLDEEAEENIIYDWNGDELNAEAKQNATANS